MYHSFVLIKSPQNCGDKKFKHQKYFVATSSEILLEKIDVIAFNCEDVEQIPNLLNQLFSEYKVKKATEENIGILTMVVACRAWFMDNELQRISDDMQQILHNHGIDAQKEDCIYVSMPDYVVTLSGYAAKRILAKVE